VRPERGWVGFAAAATAIVAACALVWSAWIGHYEREKQAAITRPVPKTLPVVAVAALQNLTGDTQFDWLSEGVANLVRDGLAESSHVVIVSPPRWQAILRTIRNPVPTAGDILGAAARAGINYVVSGEYLKGPEGLLLTARLSDVESGVELGALPSRNDLDPPALLGEATRLVLLVKQSLKIPHTESLASFAADFAVSNTAAYEAYLAGIRYFLKFDYAAAERAFRSALELAPDFHMARYRLAHVEAASGDTEAALATLERIPADAPLTPRERAYVDGAHALFAREAGKAKEIYQGVLAELPFDVEARSLLARAHDIAFENEAAIGELKRLLEQEPQNDQLWSWLGETYLRLGEYELARQALDRYLQLQPHDPYGFTVLGQHDQLTGNLDGAAGRFTQALELQPGFVPARLALAQTQMLRDNWQEAEALLRAITTDREVPAISRIDAAFDLSALLRAEGRFAASLEPLQDLEAEIRKEYIREAAALSQRGLAQAELGRFANSEQLIAVAISRSPGAPTRHLFARGLKCLLQKDSSGMRAAAAQIRDSEAARDNSENGKLAKEDAVRAASYLEGTAELVEGNSAKAAETLARVIELPGYQYSIYKLGLARAVFAAGKPAEALKLAREAATERDPGDIRLDLEVDRSRALLLEAEILTTLGQKSAAAERARFFLRRWSNAERDQPDRTRAEQIAGRNQRTSKIRSNAQS
jgi:tetratricopeptide (TPR) repeat protein